MLISNGIHHHATGKLIDLYYLLHYALHTNQLSRPTQTISSQVTPTKPDQDNQLQ